MRVAPGGIGRNHRPGLGLAIALQQRHAEADEEAPHLGFQPRPARDRRAQPAAEAGADVRRTSRSSSGCASRAGERKRLAGGPRRPSAMRPVEQPAPPCRLARHLGKDAAADDLQHARHHRHDGRTDRQHIGRQRFDPARVDDFGTGPEQEELAGRMLVAVRQRQEGQIDLVGDRRQCRQQVIGAAAVGQDRPVRQHRPLRRAAGAGGIDQAGQRLGRDNRCLGGHVAGIALVGDQRRPGRHGHTGAGKRLHRDQHVERAGKRHPAGQRGGRDHGHAGARIAQDMGVVGHRVGGVGGDRDSADRHQRGLDDRVFGAVLRDDHDAVARRHAGGAQAPGNAGGVAGECAPGHSPPGAVAPDAQHRPFRPCEGPVEHHRRQIPPLRQPLCVLNPVCGTRPGTPLTTVRHDTPARPNSDRPHPNAVAAL